MEIKALALTLPNPDKLYVMKSQKANNPRSIVWNENYREQVFSMQRLVVSVARDTYEGKLSDEQKEALINPYMTPRQAEESVKCVWVDAVTSRRAPPFLDMVEDSVTTGGLAGYDVPGGMKRFVLINNGVGATLTRDVVVELARRSKQSWWCLDEKEEQVPILNYQPGFKVYNEEGEVDFDSVEMRSSNLFINQMIRFGNKALTEEKTIRLITIPYEPRVSIVSSKGREVLREKPRQWS